MALGILRSGLLAASALLAFSSVSQAGAPAQIVRHAATHHVSQKNSDRSLTVLYDQTSHDSGIALVSQNSGGELSTEVADDFTVPENAHWTLQEVDIPGVYFNGSGPAPTVQVTIYKNKGHKPGGVKYTAAITPGDDFGSFTLNVGNVKLKPGHYWLSVVANMNFSSGGEWGWEVQTDGTVEGDRAVYRDFNSESCANWLTKKKCFGGNPGDQMFTLKGSAQ